MKKSLILTLTFLLLLSQCGKILKLIKDAKHRKESKEILNNIVIEMKRDYNLIVDKDKYEVNVLGIMPGSIFIRYYSYGIRKKGKEEYKSKYFKEFEEEYYGFIPGEGALGDDIGYRYTDNLFIM
ncbi:hypothetical protein EII29_11180, partial [Leptotrichia sp. OH3620_COT-345]|uniref:hypothetical protein n=1 Tax=Leptotrichia sp. OH3620_COT-345 TaxID=2491048 RepID=UPI000FB80E49